jgi:uncharacterized membrane protein YphA (DoxX/SURF4 family)
LLLRAAVGITAIGQGAAYLGGTNIKPLMWATGISIIVIGISLLIGLFTPFACVLLGITSFAIVFAWIPTPAMNMFDSRLSFAFLLTIVAAVFLLGPGVVSLDARFFGRREIIIPHSTRQLE